MAITYFDIYNFLLLSARGAQEQDQALAVKPATRLLGLSSLDKMNRCGETAGQGKNYPYSKCFFYNHSFVPT